MPDILPRCRLHVVALSHIVSEHQHARTYLQYQFIAQTGCRKTCNLPSGLRSAACQRSVFFQHPGAPDARDPPPSLQDALCASHLSKAARHEIPAPLHGSRQTSPAVSRIAPKSTLRKSESQARENMHMVVREGGSLSIHVSTVPARDGLDRLEGGLGPCAFHPTRPPEHGCLSLTGSITEIKDFDHRTQPAYPSVEIPRNWQDGVAQQGVSHSQARQQLGGW